MTEISFSIEWSVWVPILISVVSLYLTVRSMQKRANREKAEDVEAKIDKAHTALKECEENLRACGREKDELRRDKLVLLEHIARLTKSNSNSGNPSGSETPA